MKSEERTVKGSGCTAWAALVFEGGREGGRGGGREGGKARRRERGREEGREGGRARTHEAGGEDSEGDVGVLHGLLLSLSSDGYGAHVEETSPSA